MLTFDDGYKRPYTICITRVNKRKISGFFFPSAKVIMENSILDINLIHLILSKTLSEKDLINDLDYLLIKNNFTEKKLIISKKLFLQRKI